MTLRTYQVDLPQTAESDPRIGHLLSRKLSAGEASRVSLVGFAVDQGIARNGGRIGAAEGPRALREQLFRMCPDPRQFERFVDVLAHTRDLGDLESSGDLERDQDALGDVVARELAQGSFVIVLGGGHETTYGHFLGYVKAHMTLAIQNLDAHADVRELKAGLGHSGSPFRQAIEHPSRALRHYRVDGLQPTAVARAHLAYIAEHGGHASFRRDFRADTLFAPRGNDVLGTFCLDAVDVSAAPGVSAPSIDGLSPQEWFDAAHRAGRSQSVRSVDVVELSPKHDRDLQTVRLAARTVWELLRGFCERSHRESK